MQQNERQGLTQMKQKTCHMDIHQGIDPTLAYLTQFSLAFPWKLVQTSHLQLATVQYITPLTA